MNNMSSPSQTQSGAAAPRKKKRLFWMIGLLILIAAAAMILWPKSTGGSGGSAQVLEYPGGDSVYLPAPGDLCTDEKTGIAYCRDLISVYLTSELSDEEAGKLADLVGGKTAARLSGRVNRLQIVLSEPTLEGLQEKVKLLSEAPGVMYASIEYPIRLRGQSDDAAVSPEAPGASGAGWWAEAIDAYTAWKYEKLCQPVKVLVFDEAMDFSHPGLDGRVHPFEGAPLPYQAYEKGSHGAQVAAVMAAAPQADGTRGILPENAQLYFQGARLPVEGQEARYLLSSEYIALLKAMLESGIQVVNTSWCMPAQVHPEAQTFDPVQQQARAQYADYTARECISFLAQMLRPDAAADSRWLLCQSVSNGYTDCPEDQVQGYDSQEDGFFCAITPDAVAAYNRECADLEQLYGLTYKDLKDHILIVAAAQPTEQTEEQPQHGYQLCSHSGFGASVDIAAPGQMLSPGEESGTSFAAPMVSASAAYLWSLDPSLSAAEVKELLLSNAGTALPVSGEDRAQYPFLNLGRAVQAVLLGGKTVGSVISFHNNLYYWNYSHNGFEDRVYFLQSHRPLLSFPYHGNHADRLICRAPDGTETVLYEGPGADGLLAAAGDWLYFNAAQEGSSTPAVYAVPLVDASAEPIRCAEGFLRDSDGAENVFVEVPDQGMLILQGPDKQIPLEENSVYLCRFRNDVYYQIDEPGADRFHIMRCSVDGSARETILDEDSISDGITCARANQDTLYLGSGSFAGTGLFFQGGTLLQVDLKTKELTIQDESLSWPIFGLDEEGNVVVPPMAGSLTASIQDRDQFYRVTGEKCYTIDPYTGIYTCVLKNQQIREALNLESDFVVVWCDRIGSKAYAMIQQYQTSRSTGAYFLDEIKMIEYDQDTGNMEVVYRSLVSTAKGYYDCDTPNDQPFWTYRIPSVNIDEVCAVSVNTALESKYQPIIEHSLAYQEHNFEYAESGYITYEYGTCGNILALCINNYVNPMQSGANDYQVLLMDRTTGCQVEQEELLKEFPDVTEADISKAIGMSYLGFVRESYPEYWNQEMIRSEQEAVKANFVKSTDLSQQPELAFYVDKNGDLCCVYTRYWHAVTNFRTACNVTNYTSNPRYDSYVEKLNNH